MLIFDVAPHGYNLMLHIWCEDSFLILLNISIAISHFLLFHSITINWVLHVLQLGKGQVVGLLY